MHTHKFHPDVESDLNAHGNEKINLDSLYQTMISQLKSDKAENQESIESQVCNYDRSMVIVESE